MVTASSAIPLQKKLHLAGARTAAIVHGRDVTLPNPLYQRLVPRVFDALDLVLPVSRATGEACLQRGLSPEKLHVVPNGIDVHRFNRQLDPLAARNQLAVSGLTVPEDALLLCSVGRQVERKGFAWFIDQVLPGLPETVHYWLAGEGPETDAIRAVIEARNLNRRVRLLGRVTEEHLHLLYSGSDLFVMPNIPVPGDMEGFGVVMLEAGLCGLPVVASNLEGIRDVVADGENGHLVESGRAEAFADVIQTYNRDRECLRQARERARAYVLEQFNWKHVADQYVQTLSCLK
jgi:phosphatidylinositol alpha-1,6-mannosyltransferase